MAQAVATLIGTLIVLGAFHETGVSSAESLPPHVTVDAKTLHVGQVIQQGKHGRGGCLFNYDVEQFISAPTDEAFFIRLGASDSCELIVREAVGHSAMHR
ncbi:MAG: hypothetical protein LC624_10960 [Halobacteriales archaeon]|nr:hypothetical protein [Halobacteriales archaeon]